MTEARKGWQVSGTGSSAAKAGQEVTDAAQSTRNIFGLNRVSVMMGLMFAGGMIWVYFASTQTPPVVKDEDDGLCGLNVTIVTSGLLSMTNSSSTKDSPKTQTMMLGVDYGVKERQIPLAELEKNLFKFVAPKQAAQPTQQKPTVANDIPPKPKEPVKVPSTEGLVLKAILWEKGKPPTANISNNIIGVGDVINDWTVYEIEKKRVILKWRGKIFELKMP